MVSDFCVQVDMLGRTFRWSEKDDRRTAKSTSLYQTIMLLRELSDFYFPAWHNAC